MSDSCLRLSGDRASLLVEAIESLPFGVLFMTPQGRMLGANQAALRIVDEGDGWTSVHGQPCPSARFEAVKFTTILAEAVQSSNQRARYLNVSRSSRRPSFSVFVTPLGEPSEAVLVEIYDLAKSAKEAVEIIRTTFGLTPAESRLVNELAAGLAPTDAAAKLSVSVHTIRTQVREIFSKTGVRSRSQLVGLVHNIVKGFPPVLR